MTSVLILLLVHMYALSYTDIGKHLVVIFMILNIFLTAMLTLKCDVMFPFE